MLTKSSFASRHSVNNDRSEKGPDPRSLILGYVPPQFKKGSRTALWDLSRVFMEAETILSRSHCYNTLD